MVTTDPDLFSTLTRTRNPNPINHIPACTRRIPTQTPSSRTRPTSILTSCSRPAFTRISTHKNETIPMKQSLLHQAALTTIHTPPMRPISTSKSRLTRTVNIHATCPKTAEYLHALAIIINRLQILSEFRPLFAQFLPLAPLQNSASVASNFQLSQPRYRNLQITYGHLQKTISQKTPLSSERTSDQHGLR